MGYSNRETGRALFLAEQTVKNLASALLGKLGVPSRTAALRHAVANGWAEIGPAPRHAPAFARDPALLGGGGPSTRGL